MFYIFSCQKTGPFEAQPALVISIITWYLLLNDLCCRKAPWLRKIVSILSWSGVTDQKYKKVVIGKWILAPFLIQPTFIENIAACRNWHRYYSTVMIPYLIYIIDSDLHVHFGEYWNQLYNSLVQCCTVKMRSIFYKSITIVIVNSDICSA